MKVRFNKKHSGNRIISAFKTVHPKQKTTVILTKNIYIEDKGLQDLVVTIRIEVNIYDNIYLVMRAEDINLEEKYKEIDIRILFTDKDNNPYEINEVKLLTNETNTKLQKSVLEILGNLTDTLASYEGVPF